MKTLEIKAESRKEIGKNLVKKLRKNDKIPIVIYGEGCIPLTINSIDASKIFNLRHENFLIKLSIDGQKEKDALLKDIQLDPVKNIVTHLDFLELIAGKTITTKVPLVLDGTPEGVKMGGIVEHFLWDVTVECLPKDIPDSIKLDVSNLKIGNSIHVSDIKGIGGIKILDRANQVILTIGLPTGVIEEKAAAAAAAAEAAAAAAAAEEAAAAGELPAEGEVAAEGAEGSKEKKPAAEGEEAKGKKMTPEEMDAARRAKRKADYDTKKK